MWQSFVCAMTAAVTLQAFDPFRSGKLVLYQVTYSTGWHSFEIIPFAILGVLGVRCLPHFTAFADCVGSLWRIIHQSEHEGCPMEEISYLATRTRHSSDDCGITYSVDQLP